MVRSEDVTQGQGCQTAVADKKISHCIRHEIALVRYDVALLILLYKFGLFKLLKKSPKLAAHFSVHLVAP